MEKETLLAKRMKKVLMHVQEITIADLAKKMKHQAPFYLIDVREDPEWDQGFLPSAVHLTRGKLELNIENLTSDLKADIVLYCGGGTRSALAAESLQEMGYQNVSSLRGGYRDWVAAGLPIEIQLGKSGI